MLTLEWKDREEIIRPIAQGAVGILPTDTLYGVVCSAHNQQAVERVYTLKQRSPEKPVIILISAIEDLDRFSITLDNNLRSKLHEVWPGPVSVILPCPYPQFQYLHRGTNSLAFRLPDKEDLRDLLQHTGPFIAPSANPEGEPPATTLTEAKNYFSTTVDFYVNGGTLTGQPSKLMKLDDNQFITLRS